MWYVIKNKNTTFCNFPIALSEKMVYNPNCQSGDNNFRY